MAFGEFGNVKLSDVEFEKLVARLGLEDTRTLIEDLSCYMAAKRTKYKSHYATILMWSRMEGKRTMRERARRHKCTAICQEDGCRFEGYL